LIWTAAAPMVVGNRPFKPQIFTDETQIEKLSVPICVHLWLIFPNPIAFFPVFRTISA
jgi:hypothetical protein